MKLRLLILPALIMLVSAQYTFASESGCGSDKGQSYSERSISLNYAGKVEQPKMKKTNEVKVNMIKKRLAQATTENLEKFLSILDTFSNKVSSDHPRYYIIDMLRGYVEDILATSNASLVDIVVATQEVSILKDIVVVLDLVDTLNSEGPFTVFAPTNEAFEQLLEDLDMTFDELAADAELLRTVVLYHVVAAEVPASAVMGLTEGTLVETVGGESVRISNWDGVKVDMSNVIATDIMASNGVIHLIDEVLLPPSVREALGLATDRGEENIVATAIANGSFPTLIAAVQAAGLVETLSSEGPFTVYAPTEEAFTDLLADLDMTAEELLADTELLTKVLTYHVVPGFYTAEDIVGLDMPIESTTAQGSTVTIDPNDGSPMINDSAIIATDVYASNGVIHVIDKVLVPSM